MSQKFLVISFEGYAPRVENDTPFSRCGPVMWPNTGLPDSIIIICTATLEVYIAFS